MRNIKAILMAVLLLCLSLTVMFGLSSCDDEAPHVHAFTEKVTKEANCTEAGELTLTCECGYSYTKEIKAKGHTIEIDPAVPAQCTKGGLTEGIHCADCGFVFVERAETRPLGHKPGAAATCTTAQTCENGCGMEFAPAIGHFVVTEPTCTEGAICTLCNTEVTPALGHSIVVKDAVEPGCFTTGLTAGEHCDRCHAEVKAQEIIPAAGHIYVPTVTEPTCKAGGYTTYTCKCGLEYVDDYTEIVTHDYEGVVTAPGCFENGYTTYTCRFCHEASYVADYTAPTHVWEYYENYDGFERHCINGCDAVESAAAPVADSYKASVSKNYVSDRVNQLIIRNGQYGANGLRIGGANWAAAPDVDMALFPEYATTYPDIIRDFDQTGRWVEYEFVVDKDGYVDIIWHIASSAWNGSTNGGIKDMAASMIITIDGKPIDIKDLALPAGDNVNDPTWWNMHAFVLEGVALEEGVHTFKCQLTKKSAGLNVGYMEIKSNRNVSVRAPKVTGADIVVEDNKTIYVLTVENCNYALDEIRVFDHKDFEIVSYEVVDGTATIKVDISRPYEFYPHLSFAGQNYVNGANKSGDVLLTEGEGFTAKTVERDGRNYNLGTGWGMPRVEVAILSTTEKSITVQRADFDQDGDKLWWSFKFALKGYYPEYLQIFETDIDYESEIIANSDGTYTLRINIVDYKDMKQRHNPHLRVMGKTWTAQSKNGDIKPSVLPNKVIYLNGTEYWIRNYYGMPTIDVNKSDGKVMAWNGWDLRVENNRVYYVLSYYCVGYDENKDISFDGVPFTTERNGDIVEFKFDFTDRTSQFWPHLKVKGVFWDGLKDTKCGNNNGDVKHGYYSSNKNWNVIRTIEHNGKTYKVGIQWQMIIFSR